MVYAFDGNNYLIKLAKGERLSEAMRQFAEETNIEGGWLSGLGGALEVTLGFYNLDTKEYRWQTFEGLREITSMQGNLAFDESGNIMYHLHGTLADENYQVIGGHIKDLVVGATVEIFVHCSQKPITRKTDPAVGLQTLNLHADA